MAVEKYNVGDKVIVLNELTPLSTEYGGYLVVPDMVKYQGTIVTIQHQLGDAYHILEDNRQFYWTDEMFYGKYIFHVLSDKEKADLLNNSEAFFDLLK